MTNFETVYEQFLSVVKIDFSSLSDGEVLEELRNWTVMASSYFKFPRVSLDFVEYDLNNPGENGEVGTYFINKLSQKEISVIVEYMKLVHFELQLADSKRYEMYYEDANLKLPSQSALITQTNRAYENQLAKARRLEDNYYRSHNDKPTIGDIWKR